MDDLDPKESGRTSPEEGASTDREAGTSGDDDSLILWMLSLTPTERLAVAQGFVDSIYALRNGRRA